MYMYDQKSCFEGEFFMGVYLIYYYRYFFTVFHLSIFFQFIKCEKKTQAKKKKKSPITNGWFCWRIVYCILSLQMTETFELEVNLFSVNQLTDHSRLDIGNLVI